MRVLKRPEAQERRTEERREEGRRKGKEAGGRTEVEAVVGFMRAGNDHVEFMQLTCGHFLRPGSMPNTGLQQSWGSSFPEHERP